MNLFREKIPVMEHNNKMEKAAQEYRTSIESMAAKAGIDVTEEMTNETLIGKINATLEAAATAAQENADLDAKLSKAEEANTALTVEKKTAEDKAEAAQKVVDDASALFGEKAKADDFDLVKEVGSLVPEGFSESIETQEMASSVPKEYKIPADDYAAQLKAGKITQAEFYKKSMALLD